MLAASQLFPPSSKRWKQMRRSGDTRGRIPDLFPGATHRSPRTIGAHWGSLR
jgi:hypothetical protein